MTQPSDTVFQDYRQVRFFASLNGLRCICVFMVMWHHSPARGSMENPILLLGRGYTGVDFFFVLSGFLITTLLLREEARYGKFSLPDFYWRRLLRIVPVYFLLVTAVAGYYILLRGRAEYIDLLPYYYFFLSNFLVEKIQFLSITWSLAVEEQYYLFWPAMLLLLPRSGRVRAWVLVGLITLFVLGASVGIGESLGRPKGANPFLRLPLSSYAGLLIGSLLAVALHNRRSFAVIHAVLGSRFSPAFAFGALVLILEFLPGPFWGVGNLVVHSAMAVCIASIVLQEPHVLRPLLNFRPIARVGEISYGVYLYHLVGLHLAHLGLSQVATVWPWVMNPWILSAGMVVITLCMAEFSFRYFESFFLRLKHRRPGQRQVPAQGD